MSVIEEQVEKARARAPHDLAALIELLRHQLPREAATPGEQQSRHDFLVDSLPDRSQAEQAFERVLLGNELQPIAYLERGMVAAQSIARIQTRNASGQTTGWGTGFLIAPGVLITNNHVFPTAGSAVSSLAQFWFETNLADEAIGPISFELDPGRFFYTSSPLDFSVIAVRSVAVGGQWRIDEFGALPLLEDTGKAFEGEWLTIVQHPNGERKQLGVRENRLIKKERDVLWYSTDTLPGSSGSPVFNNDWFVVALHHSGVPEMKNGRWQTIDGRDYDQDTMPESMVKWIANEGIRASRIAATLRRDCPHEPLLRPLFEATPASARIKAPRRRLITNGVKPPSPETIPMSETRTLSVPIDLRLQISSTGEVAATVAGTRASEALVEKRNGSDAREAKFDAPFDADYTNRTGYDPDFLGQNELHVAFPELSPALARRAVPLIEPREDNFNRLHYHNYSVVMHRERRFAIYSAANIRFNKRFNLNRPKDVWRVDPRIAERYQVRSNYYLKNQFDRGHLTRREDLEFGESINEALKSAADTCHWTNCTPQHSRFNQNKEIWQGIERHVLENNILAEEFNAQVFTGPVLDPGDPEYKDIQYPLQYWKVVTVVAREGRTRTLLATAYIASQEETIAQFGIESLDVLGPFKTFQVKISEVERLTGLKFKCGKGSPLNSADPLESSPARRPRRGASPASESLSLRTGSRYLEIQDLDELVLD